MNIFIKIIGCIGIVILFLLALFIVNYHFFGGYWFDGYNKSGYNATGYDKNNYDKNGFNRQGYNAQGYDVNGYNSQGYDRNGYNKDGYDATGYDAQGYDRNGYNKDGYNAAGYDSQGFNINGYDVNGYNKEGYDIFGYDRQGYDSLGYNAQGYNKNSYNILGYDKNGNKEELNSSSQTNQQSFQELNNEEPYYSGYCDKINPYDLSVRQAAAKAITNDPGYYSFNQLFDIYDWVKNNIEYQDVAFAGTPYSASETLSTGSGDCKNQAVLIASMIGAIGGSAEVVDDPSCSHAYAIVYFGSAEQNINSFTQAVSDHYGANTQINYFIDNDSIWVIFDPAGGNYPGNKLSECADTDTKYYIDSCLDCSVTYPNSPYTYGNKCYSECPSGTISINGFSCSACPTDEYSYNNNCVKCQSGYYLAVDGLCYPNQ